jgi:hypothetical protein
MRAVGADKSSASAQETLRFAQQIARRRQPGA